MKNKKINILSILLCSMALLSFGDDIGIDSVAASSNTRPSNPAYYITDKNPSTYWAVASNETSGWLEIDLSSKSLVYGMKMTAAMSSNTRLIISYERNGMIIPFVSGTLDGSVGTAGLIDLSYDKAVTDRIYITLSGTNASSAMINEIEIQGEDANNVYHKITPTSIEASENTSYYSSEYRLVDGIVRTMWIVEREHTNKSWHDIYKKRHNWKRKKCAQTEGFAELAVASGKLIDKIKVYFTDETSGTFAVEGLVNGTWKKLHTFSYYQTPGWKEIEIAPENRACEKVRINVTGYTSEIGGIGEIELWGYGNYEGDERVIISSEGPIPMDEPASFVFQASPDKEHVLELVSENTNGAKLDVLVNDELFSVSPAFVIGAKSVYTLAIKPTLLFQSEESMTTNFVEIASIPGGFIDVCTIRPASDDGEKRVLEDGMNDGWRFTQAEGEADGIYELGKRLFLERIEVYGPPDSTYNAYALVNGYWTRLAPLSSSEGVKIYGGGALTTDKLKLDKYYDDPYEIRLLASPTTDAPPNVSILEPENRQVFEKDDLKYAYVLVEVDGKPDSIRINGERPETINDNIYKISLRELDFEGYGDFTIEAKATNRKDREGSDSITIYINSDKYDFSLDQPDEVIYTDKPNVTISGTTNAKKATITVNDKEATLSGGTFTCDVPVKYGFNLLTIKLYDKTKDGHGRRHHRWGKDEDGKQGELLIIKHRKVYRYKGVPTLTITNPKPDFLTKDESIRVSGYVTGMSLYEVSVNGTTTKASGTVFTTNPIPLTEGSNVLNITAKDPQGRTASKSITVTRDSTAPAITNIQPENGHIFAHSEITVSGQIIEAHNPTVLVNGKLANVSGGAFSATVSFADDVNNNIVIEAFDGAGNKTTPITITITVDTVKPLPFEVTIDPSGWTNDNTPTITFSTTDATSGIDRYEVLLDAGSAIIAESPYTFETIEDGTHDIVVLAYDKAGNRQETGVQALIDTTPPHDPTAFRVVPGDTTIKCYWDKPDEDITSYRLTRAPAWTSGETRILTAQEYEDTEVAQFEHYTYNIICIDRANNESPGDISKETIVGLEIQALRQNKGTIAEYDGMAVIIQEGTLPENVAAITINKVTSESFDTNSFYPIVSPIYSLKVLVFENDQVIQRSNVAFEREYVGVMSYKEEDCPKGFLEQNLGVFYYDHTWSRWFLVGKCLVDRENNRVVFATKHFTDFSIQPVLLEDLSPQEIKDIGNSPFKTDVVHQGFTVSTQGGTAMTEMTELVLPGKGGFNFVLKRIYDSNTARTDSPSIALAGSMGFSLKNLVDIIKTVSDNLPAQIPDMDDFINNVGRNLSSNIEDKIKSFLMNQGDYSYSMGVGWRLNLPYIRGANGTINLRLPDGSFHSIHEMKNSNFWQWNPFVRTLELTGHEGADFKLVVHQSKLNFSYTDIGFVIKDIYSNKPVSVKSYLGLLPDWKLDAAELYMADGTYYSFDGNGRVLSMEDPQRLNKITFAYSDHKLDKITDSMGRIINFKYDPDIIESLSISEISMNDVNGDLKTIEYNHKTSPAFVPPFYTVLLDSATDFQGRRWTYSYTDFFMISGSIGFKLNPVLFIISFIPGATEVLGVLGLTPLTIFGRLQIEDAFVMNHADGPGIGDIGIIYDPKDLNMLYVQGEDYFLGLFPTAFSVTWEDKKQIVVTSASETCEGKTKTTSYENNFEHIQNNQWYNKTMTINDGRIKTVYNFNYVHKERERYTDVWDRIQDNIENLFLTDYPLIDEYIPYEVSTETFETTKGKIQETLTETDTAIMRPTRQTLERIGIDNYTETTYTYDSWGNVVHTKETAKTGDRENTVESWMYYAGGNANPSISWPLGYYSDPSFASGVDIHNLLMRKAAASSIPLVTGVNSATPMMQYTYNRYNSRGQMTANKVFLGGTSFVETTYGYDQWGNVNKVTDPEGHETTYAYNYNYNGYWYTLEKTDIGVSNSIDATKQDITSTTAFEKATGWKAWEQNPRGFVTEYQYDKIGRIIAIKKPAPDATTSIIPTAPLDKSDTSVTLAIAYDDTNFISMVTNSRGAITAYKYTKKGQLKEIEKQNRSRELVNPDTAGEITAGTTEIIRTNIDYDAYGNITGITNPRGHLTKYDYDGMGRTTKITYPDVNGVTQATSPHKTMDFDYLTNLLSITDENGFLTEENYDIKDRLIQKRYRDKNGYVMLTEKTFYDGLGNKTIFIDGEGNHTINKYDTRNLLEKTILPEDTFFNSKTGTETTITPYIRYTYDDRGAKTADIMLDTDGIELVTTYTTDEIGRVIQTMRTYTDYSAPTTRTITEKTKYDPNGNKTDYYDGESKQWIYTYNAHDKLVREEDPKGNTTTYVYDSEGNKLAMTDPRGSSGQPYTATFTIDYLYDDLNRIIGGKLPRGYNEAARTLITLAYDARGNLKERRDADGGVTEYEYTPRNKVLTETRKHSETVKITTTYAYDNVGNQTSITDGEGKVTSKEYDTLNRVVKEYADQTLTATYTYDRQGNLTSERDAKNQTTRYTYNAYKKMTSSTDPLLRATTYKYDIRGNQVNTIDPRNVVYSTIFDELNRPAIEINPSGDRNTYQYNEAGNLVTRKDPNNTTAAYIYYNDNRLRMLTLTNGSSVQTITYDYDEAGDIKQVKDGSVTTYYNRIDGSYTPDPFSRIFRTETTTEGKTLTAEYTYDIKSRITGVVYPSNTTVTYNYNKIDQLLTVPGYIDTEIAYYNNGMLKEITPNNAVRQGFTYDSRNRLTELGYTKTGATYKEYEYVYDDNNNITSKKINGIENLYAYDELNQLTSSLNRGSFEIDVTKKPQPQKTGNVEKDYAGEKAITFTAEDTIIKLDTNSMSIGVDLARNDVKLSRMILTPDAITHRVTKESITLYVRMENANDQPGIDNWKEVAKTNWNLFVRNGSTPLTNPTIEITLLEPVAARYVKVHCYYDDRAERGEPIDTATFKNTNTKIMTVYYMVDEMYESFVYDASGNRTTYTKTIPNEYTETDNCTYYEGANQQKTNRLMTDRRFGYAYDANGNLTEKGSVYTINGNELIFDNEQGEYWSYSYDLENRLLSVSMSTSGKANASIVAEYTYDHKGYRIKKAKHAENGGETTWYTYSINGVILAKEETASGKNEEYVYVFGKYFAKRVTSGSGTEAKVFYCLTDHIGSVTMMTDASGKLVWKDEYLAFGKSMGETGTEEAPNIFGGKELDEDTSLYYYNARWMDPETGRFTSEDPARDSPNWYAYGNNNPLKFTDPTGLSGQPEVSTTPPKWFNKKIEGATEEEIKSAWKIWNSYANAEIDANIHNTQAADSPAERDQISQDLFDYYQSQGEVLGILFPNLVYSNQNINIADAISGKTKKDEVIFSSGEEAEKRKEAWKQRQADITTIVNRSDIEYYSKLPSSGAIFPSADEMFAFEAFLIGRGVVRAGFHFFATGTSRTLLSEFHHIASNKSIVGGFTEAYEKIFAKAGMTLKSPENIVELVGHSGAHTIVYKQYVLRRLLEATEGLSGKAYKEALTSTLRNLRNQLLTNPRLPYKGGL